MINNMDLSFGWKEVIKHPDEKAKYWRGKDLFNTSILQLNKKVLILTQNQEIAYAVEGEQLNQILEYS